MKRTTLTLMAILFVASPLFSQNVAIPDANFLAALIEEGVDINKDGQISFEEAKSVEGLDVSEKRILDMTGIEAFEKLEDFNCDCNPITFIDVSKNIALKRLAIRNFSWMESGCDGPYLTSLDVSNNTAIDRLVCMGNLLTRLDISNNIHLADSKKSMAELDLSRMPSLHEVCVWEDFFGTVWFDTTDSPNVYFTTECIYNNDSIVFIPDTAFLNALIEEGVDTNEDGHISVEEAEVVTSLDVSDTRGELGAITDMTGIEAFVNLETLNCSRNELTSLDVSNNTRLTYLDCHGTLLTNLDVSKNAVLISLICGYNHLVNPIHGYLTELDVSNNTSLTKLDCSSNLLSNLDVLTNTSLTVLNCGGNKLSDLDVTNNNALTHLACWSNQLASLDLSDCPNITTLDCAFNQLTSLDVSGCTALELLWCYENQLESLDVSDCIALIELNCANNLLTSLDISNNTALSNLHLQSNPSLNEVCVWTMPFPPNDLDVNTYGSNNVYFTTDCSGSTEVEETNLSQLTIYPNPSNNLLTIEAAHPDHYSANITSLNGQQIYSMEMKGTSHQIDLSSLQKGIYLITVRSKYIVATKKLIKQ